MPKAAAAAWYIIVFIWAVFLFTAIGICAGDFFAVNLSSIARALHMSDTLAGVTLLALGNGGPDLFSTWAAITSSSPELAIGELVGAASFISTVVAGSVACKASFEVKKLSLVRDALFLLITAGFLLAPLISQQIYIWYGLVMIGIYIVYIMWVLGYHKWISRQVPDGEQATQTQGEEGERPADPLFETRPLLPSSRREHPTHDRRTPRQAPAALYREIGEWRHLHGNHITAKDDYIIQPSLAGAFEHSWRKRSLKHATQITGSVEPVAGEQHSPTNPNDHQWGGQVLRTLFPGLQDLPRKRIPHAAVNLLTALPFCLFKLTVPVFDSSHGADCDHGWDRWLLLLQGVVVPQFVWIMLWLDNDDFVTAKSWLVPAAWCLLGGGIFGLAVFLFTSSSVQPRCFPLLGPFGFGLSAFWLSIIADEVVSIMKALGIIFGLSEAILGFTLFAIGNCVDDYVANMTITQHGHPVMALSACFGGPLLNILLGLGVSITYVSARKRRQRGFWAPIQISVDPILILTTSLLAATMVVVVVSLYWNQWLMQRKLGMGLIVTWFAGTLANFILEYLR